MGSWRPESGSLFRILFERCFEAFELGEAPNDESFVCYSSPSGYDCNCVWSDGDIVLTIRTPQSYGCRGFLRNWIDLRTWSETGRIWSQTTGFISICRRVDATAAHLDWVAPRSIAQGLRLAASSAEIASAEEILTNSRTKDDWFAPVLRSDQRHEYVPTSASDPRAIRRTTLFDGAMNRVEAWEVRNTVGLGVLQEWEGFQIGDLVVTADKMSENERLEGVIYEFGLAGTSSFNFSLA